MAIIPADEKVFMVDKRTNTTYGGSQALQDMQQWYTMQDVSDSVQPYKVFTALLTQSGGDDPDSFNGGELIVGTSYQLQSPSIDADFTNVGAPNNNDGTWFIATGTTPNNWGTGTVYCNYGAPVVTVLENTIGNIWFTYSFSGSYAANSDNLFTINKSSIIVGNTTWDGGSGLISSGFDGDSYAAIVTTLTDGTPAKTGALLNTLIEIRVYN